MMITSDALDALNDHTLLSRFGDLLRQDHEGNATLLRHIDAIDRRQLWAKLGYSSLFSFLVARHHMSESTAGKRIGAARMARRFPVLFTMVARGELHPACRRPAPRLSGCAFRERLSSSSLVQTPGRLVGGRLPLGRPGLQANLGVCMLAGNSASAKRNAMAHRRRGPTQFATQRERPRAGFAPAPSNAIVRARSRHAPAEP